MIWKASRLISSRITNISTSRSEIPSLIGRVNGMVLSYKLEEPESRIHLLKHFVQLSKLFFDWYFLLLLIWAGPAGRVKAAVTVGDGIGGRLRRQEDDEENPLLKAFDVEERSTVLLSDLDPPPCRAHGFKNGEEKGRREGNWNGGVEEIW